MWAKVSKYYNTKKCSVDGKQYDSKFEAGYAQELGLRVKAGEILGFSAHERIPLVVNGYRICDYYVDFVVDYPDGTVEYVELKGYPTPVFRLKWKLFCSLFEDKENTKITLIMQGRQNPPKLRKAR